MTSLPFRAPAPPPESHEARSAHSEALQRCGALLKDENFLWFLTACVGGKIADANAAAVDISRDAAARDHAAHVHDALVKLKAWTSERHEQAMDYMNGR